MDELEIIAPIVEAPVEIVMSEDVQIPEVDQPGHVPHVPGETEQVVEAAFTREDGTNLHGLVGMWAGTLLMHDIAKDTFRRSEEEEEEDAAEEPEDREHP